jgi:hypothetical protein
MLFIANYAKPSMGTVELMASFGISKRSTGNPQLVGFQSIFQEQQ